MVNFIKTMASKGNTDYCSLWSIWILTLSSSMLTPAVLSSKPTLKLWHVPTSQLQESHVHAFRMCHVHIKCFTENSLWMTDKLDRMLKSFIGLNKVRTIYDSGNQSALIPTTERCSLHYLLQSNNSKWKETYDYMNLKIEDFIIRRTFQTALIHMMEGSPLSFTPNAQHEAFQWTDGHSFFLDCRKGWLYFRNVRGDWNAWERSRNYEALMMSKMGGKWDKRESQLKIAVFTANSQIHWRQGKDTKRCAFLRVPGNKITRRCTMDLMMAEVAADFLNFTTVYPLDLVYRSGYPAGAISDILSQSLYLSDKTLPHTALKGLFHLNYHYYRTFIYCTYNLRSRSMSIAVWFFPFDILSWIVVAVLLCLFWLLHVISASSPYSFQTICNSLVAIFKILFRQSHSKPNRLSMLLVVLFLIISVFYENLITSSLIAPPEEMPIQNITEAVNSGYILQTDEDLVRRVMYLYQTKQIEDFIRIIDDEAFPNMKKYIRNYPPFGHNTLHHVINEIKHPYKCPHTIEGSGFFAAFLQFDGGMKTQLAHVFRWIHEASLDIPFWHLEEIPLANLKREIRHHLKAYKGKDTSSFNENMVSLLNLVPLLFASILCFIVASCIFILEFKGKRCRTLLIHFLALIRLRLVNAGHFNVSFVLLIFNQIQNQCTIMWHYCSEKIQRIPVKKSVNHIIWVESNN
jgi:hypothetical protein